MRQRIPVFIGFILVAPTFLIEARSHGQHDAPSTEAVINNFAPDLLDGDDGLPTSPAFPLKYGPFNTAIDVEGNGIDAHEAHLGFFDGKYWMYGREWGCGTMAFAHNRPIDATRNDKPECGMVSLSSPDLMHWHVVDRDYIPLVDGKQVGDQKPQVVWSAGLHRYLMWFAGPQGYHVAQSRSPGGPWGDVFKPTGKYLAHDLSIMVEPDGSAWVASDVMSGMRGTVPVWDVWVQKLNRDLTGTTDSSVRVMTQASFEGIGFFEHDGYWYILGGHTCPNCPSTNIFYVMAKHPLGPWMNGDGSVTTPLQPTVLSDDGCMGQDKGANVLPSPSGPVVVEGIMQYRSSPLDQSGPIVHGDNNQAIANTYWWPLRFNQQHQIEPLVCQHTVRVPLARPVPTSSPRPTGLNTSPTLPHQLDCRIASGDSLRQQWAIPPGTAIRELRIPVFQRTTNLGPEDQDSLMNAPLEVSVTVPSGRRDSVAFSPESVSWAPRSVVLTLPTSRLPRGVITVTLATRATNGCYGVVVGAATSLLANGSYSAITSGGRKAAPRAELVMEVLAPTHR